MPQAKWYSPQLRRDLVKRLYFQAQAERIPMTRLTNRLVEQALSQIESAHEAFTPRVAEESSQPTNKPG